jgi:RNA polymerase sigma factor (sigma-70 family)
MDQTESDVAKGRRKDFDKEAEKYLKMLLAFLVSRTHDRELAEEIAHKTLVKYLRKREADNWQPEVKNEGGYLVKIARNLLKDHWKAKSKTKSVSLDQQLDDHLLKDLSERIGSFDVEKQFYLEELRKTIPLKVILSKLSKHQRNLLYLRVVDELTYEQIARKVNDNPILVRYEVQKIFANVRARRKKMFGKKSLFKTE